MTHQAPTNSRSDLRFRAATVEDRPQLIALINSAFSIEKFLDGTRTDEERLAATMEKGTILLAEDGSGHIVASVYMELRGARGYLGMLAVDPAHQGKGLGRIMVKAAEEQFCTKGCEAVDIIVLNLRPELPPIYRRFGYVEIGIENFKPSRTLAPGLECHGIVMSKQIRRPKTPEGESASANPGSGAEAQAQGSSPQRP